MDCGFVCRNHEVELHGAITQPARLGQRMLAHGATNPQTACFRRDHETGICDVVPQPGPIRSQDVAADYFPILFRDITARALRKPIRFGFFARCFRIVNKDITWRDRRVKNFPDRNAIAVGGRANV